MYVLFAKDHLHYKPSVLVSKFATLQYAQRKAHRLAGRHLDWDDDDRGGPLWAYDVTYDQHGLVRDVIYSITYQEVA